MRLRKDNLGLDPAFPFSIGSVSLTKKDDMSETRHWHDCLEITCIRSGRADYFVDGRTYAMGEGDVIIFNNLEPHGWEGKGSSSVSALVAVFSPELVAEGASLFDREYLRPFYERGSNFRNMIPAGEDGVGRITALLGEAEGEFAAKGSGYRLMIKAIVLQILTLLQRNYSRSAEPIEMPEARRRSLERIARALDFIQSGYERDISLADAAREAGMSPHYFSAYFKKATGSTFVEYLCRLRVLKARQLALDTDRTLVDIAMEAGFNNMANFYRAYRRILGESPSEARRRLRA
jgi:AraC-like DNA-binding protein/quercetin dioxygenase-like cupin family protein